MAFQPQSLDDDLLAEAIGETEREIFAESSGSESPEDQDFADQLIEEMSRVDDWAGRPVSDIRLAAESTGDTPIGMSMGELDGEDAEEVMQRAYNEGAAAMYQKLAPALPQPQRPDMFANPTEWEQNLLAQMRGEGTPPPNGYGEPLAGKPDQFADPDGYERWLLAEARRQSGVNQFNEDRVNSSMKYAHDRYGSEFESAYRDLTQGLDAGNPHHRQLVNDVINSPDPGMALMGAANLARAANENAMRYGGTRGANPVFAPGLMPRRAPLRNSEGLAPRSAEERDELDVWQSATDPAGIWDNF
jgi:hypothetical protein